MYFMSHEVDEHMYLHDKPEQVKKEGLDDYRAGRDNRIDALLAYANNVAESSGDASDDDDDIPILPTVTTESKAQTPPLPFRHNPLHDLESVFWLAMYMLLAGTLIHAGDSLKHKVIEAHNEAQQKLAEALFCDRTFRSEVMLSFLV